jgi:hypothetical protein
MAHTGWPPSKCMAIVQLHRSSRITIHEWLIACLSHTGCILVCTAPRPRRATATLTLQLRISTELPPHMQSQNNLDEILESVRLPGDHTQWLFVNTSAQAPVSRDTSRAVRPPHADLLRSAVAWQSLEPVQLCIAVSCLPQRLRRGAKGMHDISLRIIW